MGGLGSLGEIGRLGSLGALGGLSGSDCLVWFAKLSYSQLELEHSIKYDSPR